MGVRILIPSLERGVISMTNAFVLIVRNELSILCGPSDGGQFDMSDACPQCGTGGRRIECISLPESRLSDRVEATLNREVTIPPRLVDKIRRITPQCVREIRDPHTGHTIAHCELIPEITLPKWEPRTTGWCTSQMDPPCPICRRDGFYNIPHVPLSLVYGITLSNFHIARTYECFGRSVLRADFLKSQFAKSKPVVSAEIKDALAGDPGLEFEPVTELPAG
jgi:hypothetical protein